MLLIPMFVLDFLCIHPYRFPDISTSTVEIALRDLVKENHIIKVGAGKHTAYIRNTEK